MVGGDDEFLRELRRVIADAAADDVVRERNRSRGLRQAVEEEATLGGLLVDLAESGAPVLVRTSADRSHRGTVSAVGRDFVVLRAGTSAVLIPLRTIASVRPLDGTSGDAATGSRPGAAGGSFAAVLAGFAVERPHVGVVTDNGDVFTGTLRAVGADVATLRPDEGSRHIIHLALGAVAEVVVFDL